MYYDVITEENSYIYTHILSPVGLLVLFFTSFEEEPDKPAIQGKGQQVERPSTRRTTKNLLKALKDQVPAKKTWLLE